MNDLVKTAISAAKKGAKLIRNSYGKVTAYQNKSTLDLVDFVTEVDKKVERLIVAEIHKSFPDHSILGEEYGKINKSKEFTWIIDPIDGTKNFIRGLGQFGISIGIEKVGQPYIGVIHDPIDKTTISAICNNGIFSKELNIKLSTIKTLNKAWIALDYGGPKRIRVQSIKALKNIYNAGAIKIIGSSVFAVKQLLQGKLDASVDTGNYWDFAAAQVLVKEAGGEVTTWNGKEVDENSKFVLWSNGYLHKPLLSLLAKTKS